MCYMSVMSDICYMSDMCYMSDIFDMCYIFHILLYRIIITINI